MSAIEKAIDSVTPGEPVCHLNLSIYPLYGSSAYQRDYLTLDEALPKGLIEIAEVSESGHVPELRVSNHANQSVLLMDGEELVGAKQNRVINLTVLVAAHSKLVLPVTCIEAGRWRPSSSYFDSSDQAVYSELRAAKLASVSDSMRYGRRRAADQGSTWESIRAKSDRMRAPSATESMSDIFRSYRERLDGYVSKLHVLPGQVGAVFAINGGVRGMDLFDHPATLARLLPKLVRSYALDAIDQDRTSSEAAAGITPAVREFLKQLKSVEPESFPAIGMGTDLRFDTEGMSGAALSAGERIVHLCAFRCSAGGGQDAHGARRRRRASGRTLFD